jgi:hypothetical protein
MNQEAEEPSIWELRRGSEILATVEVCDQDFPWNYGRISPGVEFDTVRHYFCVQPDRDTARTVREQLRQQQIVLTPRDGAPVREFTLIVEGDEARFQFI